MRAPIIRILTTDSQSNVDANINLANVLDFNNNNNTVNTVADISISSSNYINQSSLHTVNVNSSINLNNNLSSFSDTGVYLQYTDNVSSTITFDNNADYLSEYSQESSYNIINSSIGLFQLQHQSDLLQLITNNSVVHYIGDINITESFSDVYSSSLNASTEASLSIPLYINDEYSSITSYNTSYVFNNQLNISTHSVASIIAETIFNSVLINESQPSVNFSVSFNDNTSFTISYLTSSDYNVDYTQINNLSISQSSSIDTLGEASIDVSLILDDQYENIADLNDNILLSTLSNIIQNISNDINAFYTSSTNVGIIQDRNLIFDTSINLGSLFSINNIVKLISDVLYSEGVHLDELYDVNGNLFIDYIENHVLSNVQNINQSLFLNYDESYVIEIQQNGYNTNFVVKTPNKRILLSLDSERKLVTLAEDRNFLSK